MWKFNLGNHASWNLVHVPPYTCKNFFSRPGDWQGHNQIKIRFGTGRYTGRQAERYTIDGATRITIQEKQTDRSL